MKAKILLLFITILIVSCQNQKGDYVCPPCDLECDNLTFSKAGICPQCKMELVLKSELEADLNMTVNDIDIKDGSGKFLIEGGYEKSNTVLIHYHKPKTFTKDSKVIIVLPGAGRNGKDYRDAWREASEKYGLLVISPEYSEKYYPEFWSYNLGGMIYDVDIQNETFKINQNSDQWIFGDFDRIFDVIKSNLKLTSNQYDMFGHSAGGQILHRLAIFKPKNKADRILASNSGWYTIPITSDVFPYGLGNIQESANSVNFSENLIVFLGEDDNENETRGDLRRSPEVDKQGTHRLERGIYFFNESKKIASELNSEFNWKLEIVPNVGHDYKEMSKKASEYLYKPKEK
ncbi:MULTISPECIES: hypothetical protein [Maribacter]|uniref:Alpha/beta hydrolase n=1 Tax=Maribacter flavus TaxID=1658664 RepID=A0ABU7IIM8_9FLAO|nr:MULTISPECIES: hypothetical protein [Maribacter]MDC6405921.1 hypothetical protein [Maribacter sp. PR66]MEE1972827.1 hypothetical protein [Maribacter flavus]